MLKNALRTEADKNGLRRRLEIMKQAGAHLNVVSLVGVFEDTCAIYVVMERCLGGDLLEYISKMGAIPEPQAAIISPARHASASASPSPSFNPPSPSPFSRSSAASPAPSSSPSPVGSSPSLPLTSPSPSAAPSASRAQNPDSGTLSESNSEPPDSSASPASAPASASGAAGAAAAAGPEAVPADDVPDATPAFFAFNFQGPFVRLNDFTLATRRRRGSYVSGAVGSLPYKSPEMIMKGRSNEKADIWSLGVILYSMLSARWPFYSPKKAVLERKILNGHVDFSGDPWPSISDDAKDLVRRMLAVNPNERPSATELLKHPWVVKFLLAESQGGSSGADSGAAGTGVRGSGGVAVAQQVKNGKLSGREVTEEGWHCNDKMDRLKAPPLKSLQLLGPSHPSEKLSA
ncbi:unnamed protein product [Closterium sp. Naga37s-1]|nr:unnamed protein product [Closterium sp. Naga37s-1]